MKKDGNRSGQGDSDRHRPTTTHTPMPYMTSAVNSVVCPGPASPLGSRTRFPAVTSNATPINHAATTHLPNGFPNCPATAPNSVMSADVRMPAMTESTRSR